MTTDAIAGKSESDSTAEMGSQPTPPTIYKQLADFLPALTTFLERFTAMRGAIEAVLETSDSDGEEVDPYGLLLLGVVHEHLAKLETPLEWLGNILMATGGEPVVETETGTSTEPDEPEGAGECQIGHV